MLRIRRDFPTQSLGIEMLLPLDQLFERALLLFSVFEELAVKPGGLFLELLKRQQALLSRAKRAGQ